jgi:hypothetical protein
MVLAEDQVALAQQVMVLALLDYMAAVVVVVVLMWTQIVVLGVLEH